jgi:ABC-type phosphate/phosphonate transport system substrate-binding protein
MRDSDRDFRSKVLVRSDSGIGDLTSLEGRTLAVGSRDSTQARILPLHFIKQAGVDLNRVKMLPFDSDVGKHGDTGKSELEVLRALQDGRAPAGVVGDLIWVQEQSAGRVDTSLIKVLWTTPPFDHCMFDALPGLGSEKTERFQRALYAMSWDNPAHRHILELEGLKQWVPPREEGYESLRAALKELED